MDFELAKILMRECECRAAANTGEERRFFQALANTLKDVGELEHEWKMSRELQMPEIDGRPLWK